MNAARPSPALTLAVAQLAPALRAPRENAAAIAETAAAAAADLLLTPELSLTGYDLGDAVHRLAVPLETGARLRVPDIDRAPGLLVLGLPERAAAGPFNTAAVLRGGTVLFRHRKVYLPTYGMFDEGRWFGRGRTVRAWLTPDGWRVGVLICEDFWHPGLTYVLASAGIDVLLVAAAAPGRVLGAGPDEPVFGSSGVWERLVRTTAQVLGIYVALANRTGVEGAVTFAGGSLVAGPDGSVLARADEFSTATLRVELTRSELERARRPYAHARDDDPGLVVRELTRLVESA